MKKAFHLVVCFLLIVSLLCAFSVNSMALSDDQTHVSHSGSGTIGNLTYIYGYTTIASTTFASASVSCDRRIRLGASVKAKVLIDGVYQTNSEDEVNMGTSAYASVTNYKNGYYGEITEVTASYVVGSLDSYGVTIN